MNVRTVVLSVLFVLVSGYVFYANFTKPSDDEAYMAHRQRECADFFFDHMSVRSMAEEFCTCYLNMLEDVVDRTNAPKQERRQLIDFALIALFNSKDKKYDKLYCQETGRLAELSPAYWSGFEADVQHSLDITKIYGFDTAADCKFTVLEPAQ